MKKVFDNIRIYKKSYSLLLYLLSLIFCAYTLERLANKLEEQVQVHKLVSDEYEYLVMGVATTIVFVIILIILWMNALHNTDLSSILVTVFFAIISVVMYLMGRMGVDIGDWTIFVFAIFAPILCAYVCWIGCKHLIRVAIQRKKERFAIFFGVLSILFAVFQIVG